MTNPPPASTRPPAPAPPPAPASVLAPDAQPAEALAYHRLARISARHRWWRPVVGTLFVAVGVLLTSVLLYGLADVWGAARDYPRDRDGVVEFAPVPGTALDLLVIAVAIPVVLLAVRWIGRRPAGTVSSVTGGLRWGLLGRCTLAALAVVAVTGGVMFLLPADDEPARWAGWEVFLAALAMLLVLVPFQAAAEEYVFRGWLTQAVGAFFRSPWCAVVPQAVLFAAAHGWGTPWGFVDLVVFGVVAGLLTVRTGGLEAAVALHAVNNLFAFGVSAAIVDGLENDDTAADAPWEYVLVDVVGIALYAAIVLWLTRRRPPTRTAQAPPPAPAFPPYPDAYGTPQTPYAPVPGFPAPYPGHQHSPYAGRQRPVPYASQQPAPHAGHQPAPHAGHQPAPHAGQQPAPDSGPQPPSYAGPYPAPHAGHQPPPYAGPHPVPDSGPQPTPPAGHRPDPSTSAPAGRADGAGLPPGAGSSASPSDDARRNPR